MIGWNYIVKNYKKIVYLSIFQILFFIIIGIFSGPFRDGIELQLIYLGDEIIGASTANTMDITGIIFSSISFKKIIILGSVLAVIIYILYSVIEGIIWYYCRERTREKIGKYLKRFFLANLLWYPLFLIFVLINFVFSYVDLVAARYDPEGFYFLGNLTLVILIILYYFASISYALIFDSKSGTSLKKAIKMGFSRKLYKILGILLIFVLVNYIIGLLNYLSEWIFIVVGIVIIVPLMVYFKMQIINIVQNETKN